MKEWWAWHGDRVLLAGWAIFFLAALVFGIPGWAWWLLNVEMRPGTSYFALLFNTLQVIGLTIGLSVLAFCIYALNLIWDAFRS